MSDTDLIREALEFGRDCGSRAGEYERMEAALAALARVEADMAAKDSLLDRVIEAGVETWHTVVNDEPSLSSWLGLTDAEYSAWAECRSIAAVSDGETGT